MLLPQNTQSKKKDAIEKHSLVLSRNWPVICDFPSAVLLLHLSVSATGSSSGTVLHCALFLFELNVSISTTFTIPTQKNMLNSVFHLNEETTSAGKRLSDVIHSSC